MEGSSSSTIPDGEIPLCWDTSPVTHNISACANVGCGLQRRRTMKIITNKTITALAYAVIGSEIVRNNLTVKNARKVATVTGKVAATTGRAVRGKANQLRDAVLRRKSEIQSDKDIPY